MDRQGILTRVIEIFADLTETNSAEITDDTRIVADLNIDSLFAIAAVMDLENEFEVSELDRLVIADTQLEASLTQQTPDAGVTIGQIVNEIMRQLQKRGSKQ